MLKEIDTKNVINNTEDAIKNYVTYINNNSLLASEDVKITGKPDSDKCSVEYISEDGNFKISLDKVKQKVTIKADFGENKYNAVAKDNKVDIKGVAPVHSEHWSKFNRIFEEEESEWKL